MPEPFQLAVTFGGRTIENREFAEERILVGRADDCEVKIDNLGVSRHHCEVVREGKTHVLRDLRSNNGTFVNGKRVNVYNLNDGDEIHIGKFTLTYMRSTEEDELALDQSGNRKKGEEYGAGMTLQLDKNVMELRQNERATQMRAHLRVTSKRAARAKTLYLDRSVFTIGKRNCDLEVKGWFVARKHAIIFRDENGFRIVDTSQKRRTYVNGTKVDDQRLSDGDLITIGKTKIEFKVGAPNA